MDSQYFIGVEGKQSGPFSITELRAKALAGAFKRADKLWRSGMTKWEPASSVPEIFAGLPPALADEVSLPSLMPPPLDDIPAAPPQSRDLWSRPGKMQFQPAGFMDTRRKLYTSAMPVALVLIIIAEIAESERADSGVVLTTGLLGAALVITAIWAWLQMHFECWQMIPPALAGTTPGKAVGFLFIPVYNLFWMFISFYGLAKDVNKTLVALKSEKRCDEGVALTFTIVALCSVVFGAVPILGIVTNVAFYALWIHFYKDLAEAFGVIEAHVPKKRE